MRVGFNAAVISGQMTGVGYFALALVRALARAGTDIEWVLMGADPSVDSIPKRDNIRTVGCEGLPGGARRAAWQQWTLPRLAAREGTDLLYCPDYSRPASSSIPVVNTIHDLSFYASSPPFLPLSSRLWKGTLARVTIHRSARLIADSDFIRQELLGRSRIDPRRVATVHLGGEELPEQTREKAGAPFILFVGTLEARKNVVALIEAFTALRAQGRIIQRLVLVGQPGYGGQQILAAVAASPFRQDIEVRGYESRQEVLRLYRSADLLAFPSLYEGFGLPLLEAMTCGAPVVCSRAASLPEVAGDAAEYFDASSVAEMAATIERVLGSPELQESLRRKGYERVNQFSWDECARRYCEVFCEVLRSC